MVTMSQLSKGQRVHIIAGAYQRNGYGTYLATYGKVMCSVKIDGDNRPERHLWRTSVRPILTEKCAENIRPENLKEEEETTTTGGGGGEDVVSISKLELETMVKELSALKITVAQLESKLNAFLKD